MEKIFTRIFPLSLLLLSSCIKGEPRNTEADIVRCILPADILKSEPTIDDNSVQVFVVGGVDMKKLAPEFELTPGATISPESGTRFLPSAISPRTSSIRLLPRTEHGRKPTA